MSARPDTADRSLAHWSEAGRRGMEAFYALAMRDYRELEEAHDWGAELRARSRAGVLSLLDVACGSGRFPTTLLEGGLASRTGDLRVEVDLLDPSPFSIAEARAALAPPFAAGRELPIPVQDLAADGEPYDVAWAIHALYAVPPDGLEEGARRMAGAIRPGGLGVVAQATSRSHYLVLYDAYRASHAPAATPFTTAEQVDATLRAADARPERRTLAYRTESDDRAVVEGFLQRCLFDGSLGLDAMLAPGPNGDELATYLAGCLCGGRWTFEHEVHLLTWDATGRARSGIIPVGR